MGQKVRGEVGTGVLCYAFRYHKEQDSCGGRREIPASVLSFRRISLSHEFVEISCKFSVKTHLHSSSLTLGLIVDTPAPVIPWEKAALSLAH